MSCKSTGFSRTALRHSNGNASGLVMFEIDVCASLDDPSRVGAGKIEDLLPHRDEQKSGLFLHKLFRDQLFPRFGQQRELASFSSSMRSRTPGRFIHLLARTSASLPAYVLTVWCDASDPVNPLATIAQTSRGGGWIALASQCFLPVFFGFGTNGCLGWGLAAGLANLGDDLGIGQIRAISCQGQGRTHCQCPGRVGFLGSTMVGASLILGKKLEAIFRV